MMRKPCPVCGNNIVGRSDKKFCCLACKNKFHHPAQRQTGNEIKIINRFLIQNYKIMEAVFKDERENQLMIPRLLFEKMGFHFSYCTGCYLNKQGKLYRYIYNYSWMEFSTQDLMLNRKRA